MNLHSPSKYLYSCSKRTHTSLCQCRARAQNSLAEQRLVTQPGNVHPVRAAGLVPIPMVKLPGKQPLEMCLIQIA